MSYKWRKEKRERAHEILGVLWEVAGPHVELGQEAIPYFDLAEKYRMKGDKYSSFWSTVVMLYENENIVKSPQNPDRGLVRITPKGLQAFKEGQYIVENRKDYLESIEYITKWIIPVISIILSIVAFLISVVVLVHTWNKR